MHILRIKIGVDWMVNYVSIYMIHLLLYYAYILIFMMSLPKAIQWIATVLKEHYLMCVKYLDLLNAFDV